MHFISKKIIDCFERRNKVIIFGNGGSLQDAGHFAAEFNNIGPVIALNDPAKITSIGNDYSFEEVFAIQLNDIVHAGDLIIGLSSSGKSKNVIRGFEQAKLLGCDVIDFPRKGNRKGNETQNVQNYQYVLLHKIYQEVKMEVKKYFK